LRGLNSALGLFLKCIHHPYVVADLHGIDRAKGVAPVLQGNFEDAAIDTLKGLGDVRFAAFGRYRNVSNSRRAASARKSDGTTAWEDVGIFANICTRAG
jgi:hypothetical protein